MEKKDTKIKEEKIQKGEKLNEEKKPKSQELNDQALSDQYKKENIKLDNEEKEEKEKKDDEKEKENKQQSNDKHKNVTNENNNNSNNNNSIEKSKRHRRGKNEIDVRNYRCPDCDKCYLSRPALTIHRKIKHGYGNDEAKKNRGRPSKKDGQNEYNENENNPLIKFITFFNNEKRKNNSLNQTSNDKIFNINTIKDFFQKIFNQCKKELFKDIKNVEKYTFYELFVQNWDNENPFTNRECFSAMTEIDEPSLKVQTYNLDELFFLYLKEFSHKANKDYFWFMFKFIVLFRECINKLRNNLIKIEDKDEKNQLYTQIYNAETVPYICNDFYIEFMEPHNFFGLFSAELIELIQHFCYWLYSSQFTHSFLTLL